MQTFATLIAFACLFWSVLFFLAAFNKQPHDDKNIIPSVAWLIAAALYFLVAKT